MTYHAGDLVFAHNKDLIGRAIRAAEWLHFRKGSKFNHVAILYKPVGDDWLILQAETRGVTCTKMLSSLLQKGGTYTIVSLNSFTDQGGQYAWPGDVVDFARTEVGSKYGFLTIVSILFTLFTPKFVNVMLPNTWICSALAAESLRAGGWIQHWPDVYQVNPAELYEVVC